MQVFFSFLADKGRYIQVVDVFVLSNHIFKLPMLDRLLLLLWLIGWCFVSTSDKSLVFHTCNTCRSCLLLSWRNIAPQHQLCFFLSVWHWSALYALWAQWNRLLLWACVFELAIELIHFVFTPRKDHLIWRLSLDYLLCHAISRRKLLCQMTCTALWLELPFAVRVNNRWVKVDDWVGGAWHWHLSSIANLRALHSLELVVWLRAQSRRVIQNVLACCLTVLDCWHITYLHSPSTSMATVVQLRCRCRVVLHGFKWSIFQRSHSALETVVVSRLFTFLYSDSLIRLLQVLDLQKAFEANVLVCLDWNKFAIKLLFSKWLSSSVWRLLCVLRLSFVVLNDLVLWVVEDWVRLDFAMNRRFHQRCLSVTLIWDWNPSFVFVFSSIWSHFSKVLWLGVLLCTRKWSVGMNLLVRFHHQSHHCESLLHQRLLAFIHSCLDSLGDCVMWSTLVCNKLRLGLLGVHGLAVLRSKSTSFELVRVIQRLVYRGVPDLIHAWIRRPCRFKFIACGKRLTFLDLWICARAAILYSVLAILTAA